MKISRRDYELHDEAVALAQKPKLTTDEKCFVLDHYDPRAKHNVAKCGAFFTPREIARATAMWHGGTGSGRVVDACAGIGALAFELEDYGVGHLICIEQNPEFVAIGKKIVPDATWLCGDIFTMLPTLHGITNAITNPPFGKVATNGSKNFPGAAHMGVLELLAKHTKCGGVAIIPDADHSQIDRQDRNPSNHYHRFRELHPEWCITPVSQDMRCFESKWKGALPSFAIVSLEPQT